MKSNPFACGLCLLVLGPPLHAESTAPTYSIKQEVTGSSIPKKVVQNIYVPPNKTYSQLTPEEKRRVKAFYEPPLGEDDEPPYPEHGLREILEVARVAQQRFLADGPMFLTVSVNTAGVATSVHVRQSPDKQLTRAMADVLFVTKYKPAVCHGVPCKMEYPFSFLFKTAK
jgi:hypothetical protein